MNKARFTLHSDGMVLFKKNNKTLSSFSSLYIRSECKCLPFAWVVLLGDYPFLILVTFFCGFYIIIISMYLERKWKLGTQPNSSLVNSYKIYNLAVCEGTLTLC